MSSVAQSKRPMTDKQALAAAQKRWGKYACVRHNPRADVEADRAKWRGMTPERIKSLSPEQKRERAGSLNGYRCTVGKIVGVSIFPMLEVHGQGDTWEAALAKADAYDTAERERYAKYKAATK